MIVHNINLKKNVWTCVYMYIHVYVWTCVYIHVYMGFFLINMIKTHLFLHPILQKSIIEFFNFHYNMYNEHDEFIILCTFIYWIPVNVAKKHFVKLFYPTLFVKVHAIYQVFWIDGLLKYKNDDMKLQKESLSPKRNTQTEKKPSKLKRKIQAIQALETISELFFCISILI